MTWTYTQLRGGLWRDGQFEASCYSGHGDGLNNPDMEAVRGVGPIPRGAWKIGPWHDHPHLGPCVAELTPVGFDPHGRSEFFIHGAHANDKHDSSDGCIVAGPTVRHMMRDSGDTDLTVTE